MGQARHGPAQGAARLVVVEGRFMGGHGVHDPVVLEVGDWLQKQLVLAANQFIIVDPCLLRHQLDRILRTKYFLMASIFALVLPLLIMRGIACAGV